MKSEESPGQICASKESVHQASISSRIGGIVSYHETFSGRDTPRKGGLVSKGQKRERKRGRCRHRGRMSLKKERYESDTDQETIEVDRM